MAKFFKFALILAATFSLTACWESENKMEDAGEQIEETTDDAMDSGERVEESVEDTDPEL